MASYNFYLDNAQVKKGYSKVSIYFKFEHLKKPFRHDLPFKINPALWNQNIKAVEFSADLDKEDRNHAAKINHYLIDLKIFAVDLFEEMSTHSTNDKGKLIWLHPSKDEYKEKFKTEISEFDSVHPSNSEFEVTIGSGRTKLQLSRGVANAKTVRKDFTTLPILYGLYLDSHGDLADSTKEGLENYQSILEGYEAINGKLYLDTLSLPWHDTFKNYLLNLKNPDGSKRYRNSALNDNLKWVKTVVKYFDGEYEHMNNRCLRGKPFETEKAIHYLTYEEVEKFKYVQFSPNVIECFRGNKELNGRDEWTTTDVAVALNLREETVLVYVSKRGLPTVNKGDRQKGNRYNRKEVLDWYRARSLPKYEQSIEAMKFARDMFCFLSYCPLRYQDLVKLTASNLRTGTDDEGNEIPILDFIAQKNQLRVKIPLDEYTRSIIRKYDGVDPNGFLFPVPSNDKLNKQLTRAMRICGFLDRIVEDVVCRGRKKEIEEKPLWKAITIHCARHTFGTNMVAAKVQLIYVQQMLGHKDISSTQVYVGVRPEKVNSTILRQIEQFKDAERRLVAA